MSAVTYSTPNVRNSANFKEYFLLHDSLRHMNQVNFTIFERYMCKAGCDTCYLAPKWMPDEQFKGTYDSDISDADEQLIVQFFSMFPTVASNDDLHLLRCNYPQLYAFYQRNSHLMDCSSLTDVSFIQQQSIIKELNFKRVYEVTFSDTFLNRADGNFVRKLCTMLQDLNAHTPIVKLKVIVRSEHGENSDNVAYLVDFAKSIGLVVGMHNDFTQNITSRESHGVLDYQENNLIVVDGMPLHVLSEAVYMCRTHCFLSFWSSVSAASHPFYDIRDNDLGAFVVQSLIEKLRVYRDYVAILPRTCTDKMLDYYTYVISAIQIHTPFTFIPNVLIPKYTALYGALIDSKSFAETPYGLLRINCNTIDPMLEIVAKPKHKIQHIPIKFVHERTQ